MFCPKCGSQNQDANKFCRKCGKNLPARTEIRQAGPRGFASAHSPGFLGQVLDGKYKIESKLGTGGMGDVYRATRLLIGDTVAVKILHPHLAIDPQAAERFRREAVMATKLRHRNVVGIYDVGISAAYNVPYILMELAEGFTLRQIISQYRVMPLDFAVTVTTQVCSALDEAHELGIVHRDIKPENIIANETTNGWHIKVLDFGIAKLYSQADIGLTQDGTAMGTPQYMSPEQCLGEPVDARSDVYSAGIVIYEMLCGTVPFKSATASAVAVFQVQNQPPAPRSLNSEIHPDVEAVLLRCLEKDPNNRPNSAAVLSTEFKNAAAAASKEGANVSVTSIPVPDTLPEFSIAELEHPVTVNIAISDEIEHGEVVISEPGFPADSYPPLSASEVDDSSPEPASFEPPISTLSEPLVDFEDFPQGQSGKANVGGITQEVSGNVSADAISDEKESEFDLFVSNESGPNLKRFWPVAAGGGALLVAVIGGAALLGGPAATDSVPASNGQSVESEFAKPLVENTAVEPSPTPTPGPKTPVEARKSSPSPSKTKAAPEKKVPAPRSNRQTSNSSTKDWRCVYTNSC